MDRNAKNGMKWRRPRRSAPRSTEICRGSPSSCKQHIYEQPNARKMAFPNGGFAVHKWISVWLCLWLCVCSTCLRVICPLNTQTHTYRFCMQQRLFACLHAMCLLSQSGSASHRTKPMQVCRCASVQQRYTLDMHLHLDVTNKYAFCAHP